MHPLFFFEPNSKKKIRDAKHVKSLSNFYIIKNTHLTHTKLRRGALVEGLLLALLTF